MRFTSSATLGFLVILAAGCTDRAERADPSVGERTLVIAEEVLSIGTLEAGPAAFGRVSGLTEDDRGRIYVADSQAQEIRVFAPDGAYLFSFGRGGAGPGELAGPCCIAQAPDGTLWIRDGGNNRYSGFRAGDSSAVFVASRRMAHSDGSYMAPVAFTAAGELVDVGHRHKPGGESELVRFVADSSGAVSEAGSLLRAPVEELGGHTVTRHGGSVRMYFYQPYAARDLVTHGPAGRWAHAISSAYDVTLREGEGTHRIVRAAEGPPLSAAERAAAVRRMEGDAERAGVSVGDLPYGVPDRKPPIQAIFFDQIGRLWVEVSQTDGQPRIADVWDVEGTLLQTVQWPEDVSLALPAWVGEHSALGVRRDSLDVQYVVRLTF